MRTLPTLQRTNLRTSRRIVQIALLTALLGGAGAWADDPAEDAPRPKGPAAEAPKAKPAAEPTDAFAAALKAMGLAESDLGYRPKAHWPRYPHPKTVPYVMPFFEDLLANPLDTYMFTRTLGNAVEDLLTPELLRAAPTDTKRGTETLYKLGVMLATERRIGGFRVFGMDTAHLDATPLANEPLWVALASPGKATADGMGLVFDPPLRHPSACDDIPVALQRPLASLVLHLLDAQRWIERGLRHVSAEQRAAVFATLPDLVSSTPDGTKYFPIIDDVARVLDEASLHFGCLKALQAVQNARRALGALPVPKGGWPPFEFRQSTAHGEVLFDNKPGKPQRCENPFLVVRFGSGGAVEGVVGATSATRSLSVALLMGSAPRIGLPRLGELDAVDVQSRAAGRAQIASGILGCGIVYSAGDHDTHYTTGHWGLGAGLFGLGALIDEGGNDHYRMASTGQGAAFFGAGLLLDAAGDDRYELAEGDGQGFGGPGGIGILADRSGDDHYYAEADARKAGRADYHSKDKIAVSNAQGVGSGRRGDISDGHVWAGGLGALIDVDGDDIYDAGNFSQGLGYWYGTGLLWDGGGDDRYRSVYFTQGSGAHFAIGALIDEGGNDRHELWDTAGAGLAFGWDVVNAFLIDRGTGNDYYEAKLISLGVAEVRSNAFFLDEGGDDTYVTKPGGTFRGDVDDRKSYREPGRTSDFPWRLGQVAVFLDLGGDDRYLVRSTDATPTPHPEAKNGGVWHVRSRPSGPGARTAGAPNCAYGGDVENADVGFLRPFPARTPPKPLAADAPKRER